MFKKLSDEELREWVEKQMEKENRAMENNFFSRVFRKKDDITDEELDRFFADAIKRLEMQEELKKEEEEKERLRKEKWKKRFSFKGDSAVGYRKLSKVAGFVIVSALAVFAASMTIEANRNYFVDSVKYLTGNDTKLLIDNDTENERPSLEEEQVRQEIEETMGVEVPEFLYRPETFEFYKYEMNRESGTVGLQYWYEENIVSLYISKSADNIQSNNLSIAENGAEMIYIAKEEIPIIISEIQEKGDTAPNYLAEWEWKGCYYQLSGKMPKKIFEKILKEMIF
ncbi:MAG: DUF4367 domain-containing protein [Clostridiales bacterium]|nr:DUF4367 domain-containing protein [Clostridiales bacterium]